MVLDTQFIDSTITQAHLDLTIGNRPITLYTMFNQMQGVVIDCYDGTPFQDYISNWMAAIGRHLQSYNIDISKSRKPDWTGVASGIILKASRCEYSYQPCKSFAPDCDRSALEPGISTSTSIGQSASGNISRKSTPAKSSSSFGKSSASNVSSSAGSSIAQSTVDTDPSDTPSVKLIKLSKIDYENIEARYALLDKDKMWKLSTGTVVEEKMKEVALTFEYEHPCHSLVLDVNDLCWADVFKSDELVEIRRFRAVDMPAPSLEVDTYFNQLRGLDAVSQYSKIDSDNHPIASDSNWLQKSYRDTYRLLASGFFPFESQTEANVVKRVWASLDSCFDFSSINCVTGEKCCKATADASNKDRCLSDFGRQSSGRKMDYLFSTQKTGIEVGCGECALVGGIKTTKELVDARFKMPKVMRDMANSIFRSNPALLHDLCVVGYYIGGDAMQLLTLDFPGGYVARLDGFGPVFYPKIESQIEMLPRVLKLILGGRTLMENAKAKIEQYQEAPIGRLGDVYDYIVPTFVPASPSTIKRRRSNLTV